MLTRSKRRTVLAITATTLLAASPAYADVVASDGGNTVTVTVSGASSTHGSSTPGKVGVPSVAEVCTTKELGTALTPGLDPIGTEPGHWFLKTCYAGGALVYSTVTWIPSIPVVTPPVVSQPPKVTPPSAVAAEAESQIQLPSPQIELNPAPFSIVSLETWMWIQPGIWHADSATATVGSISATATATPRSVSWVMGDGAIVICNGPGTPYSPDVPADQQNTSCSHTYEETSRGQPSSDGNPNDAAFEVTATITWAVSWASSVRGQGGTLASLKTETITHVRVEQIQSVNSTN